MNDPIDDLVRRAVTEKISFPRDPADPDAVQIRLTRNATDEARGLAAVLRERHDELNRFHQARRPAWPNVDDGLPPRLDPDEPDGAIFQIRLAAILFEDELAAAIEEMVAAAQQQITEIVEQAVAVCRAATIPAPAMAPSSPRPSTPAARARNDRPHAVEFRSGKVVPR